MPVASRNTPPSFETRVDRDLSMPSYTPRVEEDENVLFMAAICVENPGPLTDTRDPIPAGTEINLVDPFTGRDHWLAEKGRGYMYKQMWFSFDQPVRFQMFHSYLNDVVCRAYYSEFSKPLQSFGLSWNRSMYESIDHESKVYHKVKNLGTEPAHGKCWVFGFEKEGAYERY